jgi:hypothetical protein
MLYLKIVMPASIPEDEALRQPDKISTSVVDSDGRFHHVFEGFFDSFREQDLKRGTEYIDMLRSMDFKHVFNTIFSGDDPKLIGEWTEKLGHYLKESGKLVGKIAVTQAAAYLTAATDTPLLTSYLGSSGKFIIAELVGTMATQALELFGFETKQTLYSEGSWCIVDMLKKRHDSKRIKRQEMYMETAMFGSGDETMRKDLEREDYSVGFYLVKGDILDRHMVFVYEAKKVMEIKSENLRLMSESMAAKYDANIQYTLVRDIFIMKESDAMNATMDSTVACQPGSEVVYKYNFYAVVECSGSELLIADSDGRRKKVDMGDVTRGRTLTSTTYHMTQDGPAVTNGFNVKPLSAGDYCWLPSTADEKIIYPGCEVSLAVISYFQGQLCICFKVYNGHEVQINESRIIAVDPRLQNFFAKIREFQKFRQSATQSNSNVLEKAVGKKYVSITFGDIEGFPRILYEITDPGETVEGTGESEIYPRADNALVLASQTDGELQDESDSDTERKGTEILGVVGILTAVSILYFALQ